MLNLEEKKSEIKIEKVPVVLVGNAFAVVVADPALVLDGAAFAAYDYDFGVGPDDYKPDLPINATHSGGGFNAKRSSVNIIHGKFFN